MEALCAMVLNCGSPYRSEGRFKRQGGGSARPDWAREFLERRLRDEARWTAASRGWHDGFMRQVCDAITVTEPEPGTYWAEIHDNLAHELSGLRVLRQMERCGQTAANLWVGRLLPFSDDHGIPALPPKELRRSANGPAGP